VKVFRTGFRTTEFWITLFTVIGVFIAGLTNTVSPQYTIYLTTGAAVAYAVSRAIQKYGADLKHGYMTTEFWVGILSAGLVAVQTVQGNLPNHTAALAITVITAVLAAVRAFSKPNPLANPWHPALAIDVPSDNPDWPVPVVETPPTPPVTPAV